MRISLSLTVEQSESRWLLLLLDVGGRSYELDLTIIPSAAGVVVVAAVGFLLFSSMESRRL
jgi:hypothetical protein